MSNDVIIEVEKLSKEFKSGGSVVKAVDNVSFELTRGKMMAIKGMSGSGKSTLLNLLGALDRPSGGSILVDGIEVGELRGHDESEYRLRKVGFVFQSYNLLPGPLRWKMLCFPWIFHI